MRPNRGARTLAFGLLAVATAVSILAAAQTKKPSPKVTKKPAAESAESDAARDERPQPTVAVRDAAAPAAAGVVEQRTTDAGKVFRFGEVEVEARLKSPQIVYFLRRVRAEFAAGDLGHRTFLRELGETRNEPVF